MLFYTRGSILTDPLIIQVIPSIRLIYLIFKVIMALKTYLTSVFLVVCTLSFAQQKEKTLSGFLGVEGGESFTFKLIFTDSADYIKGYSYTWLYEKSEVQASILGYIDKKNRTLSFRETSIVYNHGFQSNTTICLINAVLKYKQEGSNMVFSGPITSSDASNESCGRGTISFTDNENLRSVFQSQAADTPIAVSKPAQVKQPVSKPIRIIYDTATSRPATAQQQTVPSANNPEKITAGVEKIYEWNSETVQISIWDGGRVDGDIITVLYNNAPVLTKYKIVKEVKELTLPATVGTIDVITIIANNEGNEPPNTTNILLTDGKKQYPVVAYNTAGKQAIIKIKRVR